LMIGPGLSRNPETQQLIFKLLLEYRGKVLVDADGLNAIAANGISKLRSAHAQFILTPHVGEFSRLTGLPSVEVEHRRIEAARVFAKQIGTTVVLKGVPTVTASKEGNCFLNSTGNPGMASGGMGDVLSGVIAGLLAQYPDESARAVEAAVYLHGFAADLAVRRDDEHTLMATDSLSQLARAFRFHFSGQTGYLWLQGAWHAAAPDEARE